MVKKWFEKQRKLIIYRTAYGAMLMLFIFGTFLGVSLGATSSLYMVGGFFFLSILIPLLMLTFLCIFIVLVDERTWVKKKNKNRFPYIITWRLFLLIFFGMLFPICMYKGGMMAAKNPQKFFSGFDSKGMAQNLCNAAKKMD